MTREEKCHKRPKLSTSKGSEDGILKNGKNTKARDYSSSFTKRHKPHKPSARARVGKGRHWTLSIALPGSILANAQTDKLRTVLAGQIARTCAIFSVSEIVVFHEDAGPGQALQQKLPPDSNKPQSAKNTNTSSDLTDMDAMLARILEYLETPQYLRKALLPFHATLRDAGLLPPLDMPHHLRINDDSPFREGVVMEGLIGSKEAQVIWVNIGLHEPLAVPGAKPVPTGTRVTVQLPTGHSQAKLVSQTYPTESHGLSWGYNVRFASSISKIFTESPYRQNDSQGYDLIIGTSERGIPVDEVERSMPNFQHVLIVFGGLSGLELSIAAEPLFGLSADDAGMLFDFWTNICPGQGSRTIRTEEALMIALSRLKPCLEAKGEPVNQS